MKYKIKGERINIEFNKMEFENLLNLKICHIPPTQLTKDELLLIEKLKDIDLNHFKGFSDSVSFNSTVSNELIKNENEIIKMLYSHYNQQQISEKLAINLSTLEKRIKKLKTIHNVKNIRQLILKYANC